MKKAIAWMAENHVAANLLMLVFVVGGLVIGPTVKQEVFPEVNLDVIKVQVIYPGASPEEVEEGIILKIEENISSVDGIKEVKAVASEGIASVFATVREDADADLVLQDIKSEVDRITTFPEDAEKPVISKLVTRREVISVAVYGDVPERTLREQAEMIRDELLRFDDITQVELSGVRPYEISIEVPEVNLRRYNLTLDRIAALVRAASLDLPGGAIKAKGGEILVRVKDRRYTGRDYADLPVIATADGAVIRLGDIAEVRDSFEETDTYARFDGKPAAMVVVFRVGPQKPTEIAQLVHDFVEEKKSEMPPSVRISTWNDTSEMLASRMHLLIKNAAMGLVLVFITLSLFLQMRLALWVMMGIPISFLGAMLFLPQVDVSINMISLFAFIMALGIVVDDAIVVGENIFEHRQKGKDFLTAARDGAIQVGIPVVFSVLTTVAAFAPLANVAGTIGKFIRVIPLVVISILMVSLIESLFVLPAHLSLSGRPGNPDNPVYRIRARVAELLSRFINGPYRSQLELAIRYRYLSLAVGIAVLILAVGMVRGGMVKFRFMPVVDGDLIKVNIQMPRGALVSDTGRVHDLIVSKIDAAVAPFRDRTEDGKPLLRHTYSVVGGTIAKGGPAGGGAVTAPHLSTVAMQLVSSDERDVAAEDITNRWRELVGEVPGVESLTFSSNLVHMGANIDVQFSHNDFSVLEKAAARLEEELARYPGVEDVEDTYAEGKREFRLHLLPEARTLGISAADLAHQVRAAFYGAEALRIQRGRNEVKVMVRYPASDRRSPFDLAQMWIRTPAGGEIPLSRAARIEQGTGYSEINRDDRKRVINVTASVNAGKANAEEIIASLKAGILARLVRDYPGLTYEMGGEEKERRDSMASMGRGFSLALFAIYALLAIPFRSYSQPLVVMSAIPFGIVGAIAGHMLLGFDLSILSMFGIVALSGVVVNDSLLLIDRINQGRKKGESLTEAVMNGGMRRFRPILLTSLTTFFGLAPMLAETSVQAQFLIPMAISLAFGIMFATFITLLLVPVLYLILEDIKVLVGRRNHVPVSGQEEGAA